MSDLNNIQTEETTNNSSFEEIDVSQVINALDDKKPTLYKKSNKEPGHYTKRRERWEDPNYVKKRNDPATLERLAKARSVRMANLVKKRTELPKKKIEQEALKVKAILELERLQKKNTEEEKRLKKEAKRKEIAEIIKNEMQFAFKGLSFNGNQESKPVDKPAEPVKSKYSNYSSIYS